MTFRIFESGLFASGSGSNGGTPDIVGSGNFGFVVGCGAAVDFVIHLPCLLTDRYRPVSPPSSIRQRGWGPPVEGGADGGASGESENETMQ